MSCVVVVEEGLLKEEERGGGERSRVGKENRGGGHNDSPLGIRQLKENKLSAAQGD